MCDATTIYTIIRTGCDVDKGSFPAPFSGGSYLSRELAVKKLDGLIEQEKEHISPMLKAFNEKVRPHLSEDQMNLIYARYGMNLSLEEIAAMLPPGKDGKPKTHQAVTSRSNKIIAKVKKYMAEE